MAQGIAFETVIDPAVKLIDDFQHYPAENFPMINPIHWLHSHFAVGGISPLQRLSGMLTAHMSEVAPHYGFTWHPHRGVEIYTWMLEGELSHEDTTGGKGVIGVGELQRMFSGDFIQHKELNRGKVPARLIQIVFAADPAYRSLEPHYQQVSRDQLVPRQDQDAVVYSLIGDQSPIEQHVDARLTATQVPAGGITTLEAPRPGEELFLYVTDGEGGAEYQGEKLSLGLYDVILARPTVGEVKLKAGDTTSMQFLSFYLPQFLG